MEFWMNILNNKKIIEHSKERHGHVPNVLCFSQILDNPECTDVLQKCHSHMLLDLLIHWHTFACHTCLELS